MAANDLLYVYLTTIRPIAEYAAPAFHSLLSAKQSDAMEWIQRRALKIIFGPRVSYAAALEATNIPTLEDRRNDLLKKFAIKAAKNERFNAKWFPLNYETGHGTRNRKKYLEFNCKTDRTYKSPLFAMRRVLNSL